MGIRDPPLPFLNPGHATGVPDSIPLASLTREEIAEMDGVLGVGKHPRGFAERLEVRARGAAIDALQLVAIESEADSKLDQRMHQAGRLPSTPSRLGVRAATVCGLPKGDCEEQGRKPKRPCGRCGPRSL